MKRIVVKFVEQAADLVVFSGTMECIGQLETAVFSVRAVADDLLGLLEVASLDERRHVEADRGQICLLYTSPSPRDLSTSRMPSSA